MGNTPYGKNRPVVDETRLSSLDGNEEPWAERHVSDMKEAESGADGWVNTVSSGATNVSCAEVNQSTHNLSMNIGHVVGHAAGPLTKSGVSSRGKVNASSDLRWSKSEARRLRRPGRSAAVNDKAIEFPPTPNRRMRAKPVSQNGGTYNSPKPAKNNRHPNKQHNKRQVNTRTSYAALDLGTNNCRLLVAIPQRVGDFQVVDAFSRIVRLGKGLEKSGKLDEAAMDRAIDALSECAKKLRNDNIGKIRLIATEACRRAKNGALFLERVRLETGLELEVVNRKTEAQLAAEGCGALVDKKADGAVLFDIGGGSSELILLDRRGRKGSKISDQISSWTSLPVGVVTLSERHGGKHVTRKMFDAMVEDVDEHIMQFEGRNSLDEFWKRGRVHLLGTSGTVTTLAGVHLKLPRYDRRQVDGIWLNNREIDRVVELLIDMDYGQRAANPCIGKERADLVLAGCAILQSIRKTWPTHRLRVADRGLREGILTQMMHQDGVWTKGGKRRRRNSRRSSYNSRGPKNSGGNSYE